ncbi:MAG: hypothetical protein P1V34_18345, partial [Alphaproteobacteria bacterium]|nr:hypothetical protein [Alphaproteobacteria bacterium]
AKSISFARNPAAGLFTTTVTEPISDTVKKIITYSGTQLTSEYTMKDGKLHGWQILYPQETLSGHFDGQKTCYQNGELVKALTCPTN